MRPSKKTEIVPQPGSTAGGHRADPETTPERRALPQLTIDVARQAGIVWTVSVHRWPDLAGGEPLWSAYLYPGQREEFHRLLAVAIGQVASTPRAVRPVVRAIERLFRLEPRLVGRIEFARSAYVDAGSIEVKITRGGQLELRRREGRPPGLVRGGLPRESTLRVSATDARRLEEAVTEADERLRQGPQPQPPG